MRESNRSGTAVRVRNEGAVIEPLEARRMMAAGTSDADDQISEANLTKVGAAIRGQWSDYGDVDMYHFRVQGKSRIAFQVNDLDNRGWLNYHANIVMFDAAGNFVESDSTFAPVSPAYFEAKFETAGDFYIAVSFENNKFDPFLPADFVFNPVTGENDFSGFGFAPFTFPLSYELKTTLQPYATNARVDDVQIEALGTAFEPIAGLLPGLPGAVGFLNPNAQVITYRTNAGGIAWRDANAFTNLTVFDTIANQYLFDSFGSIGRVDPKDVSFRPTGEIASLSFDHVIFNVLTGEPNRITVHLEVRPQGTPYRQTDVFPREGKIFRQVQKDVKPTVADVRLLQGDSPLVGINLAVNYTGGLTTSLTAISVTPGTPYRSLIAPSWTVSRKFDELLSA